VQWVAKEATATATATRALEDEAASAETKEGGTEEMIVLYSDQYYTAQKAKRQAAGCKFTRM
jgi:translation initiation factor 4G